MTGKINLRSKNMDFTMDVELAKISEIKPMVFDLGSDTESYEASEASENPDRVQCNYCGKNLKFGRIKVHLRSCMKKHKGVIKFASNPVAQKQIEKTKKPQS